MNNAQKLGNIFTLSVSTYVATLLFLGESKATGIIFMSYIYTSKDKVMFPHLPALKFF